MEKKIIFFVICLSFINTTFGARDADWDKEYTELCSYDSKFCGKLKNSDGTFVRPKKEVVALLKELAPYIEKSAKQLGVDPRAIAGSIMAENSLNVGISDGVQNLLVKIGVANKGEVLGKRFSYGLGQLNFAAAREAEDYVAKLENRRPLNDNELSEAITIPEKSIYLVGAVIRKVQDDYKKQGIDISKRPEILTTLYNLGKSETKAVETKKTGKLPRPNFFGLFVDKYIDDLSFLKKTEAVDLVKADTKSRPQAVQESPVVMPKGILFKSSASVMIPMKMPVPISKKIVLAFNKSMPLYISPPTCSDGQDYGSTNLKNKYESMKAYAVAAIAEKEKTFKTIVPTIDCEANAWQLIELESGEVGWIKKDDLESSTSKLLVADQKCKTTVDAKCSAKVNEQLKKMSINYPEKNPEKEILARPYSLSKKISFDKPDWSCVKKDEAQNDLDAGYNMSGSVTAGSTGTALSGIVSGSYGYPTTVPQPPKVSEKINSMEDLNSYLNLISLKKKEIEEKFKAPLTDPLNPYYDVDLDYLKKGVTYCLNKQKYNLSNCQINKSLFEDLIKKIGVEKNVSSEDKNILKMNFTAVLSGASQLHTKDSIKKMNQSMGQWGYGFMSPSSFFGSVLNDQYKLRDGDENKWSLDDVEKSLKTCFKSIEKIEEKIANSPDIISMERANLNTSLMYVKSQSLVPATEAIDFINKMKDDEKKNTWDKVQLHFVPISKVCLSLDELFEFKRDAEPTHAINEYTCFYNGLNILESSNELMLKNIMKETLLTTNGMVLLGVQFQAAFNSMTAGMLGLIDPAKMGGMGMGGMFASSMAEATTMAASYCPNKTAEMIEDIMKNNSCIQHVYLPDKWMVNRLNEFGEKIVYRPFEKDDQFSFDVERTQCN